MGWWAHVEKWEREKYVDGAVDWAIEFPAADKRPIVSRQESTVQLARSIGVTANSHGGL